MISKNIYLCPFALARVDIVFLFQSEKVKQPGFLPNISKVSFFDCLRSIFDWRKVAIRKFVFVLGKSQTDW